MNLRHYGKWTLVMLPDDSYDWIPGHLNIEIIIKKYKTYDAGTYQMHHLINGLKLDDYDKFVRGKKIYLKFDY